MRRFMEPPRAVHRAAARPRRLEADRDERTALAPADPPNPGVLPRLEFIGGDAVARRLLPEEAATEGRPRPVARRGVGIGDDEHLDLLAVEGAVGHDGLRLLR
jgi:hypothetical protein